MAKSNQFPCKLVDLVVVDKTESVETDYIAGVDIADGIDIAGVDTSLIDHYHSLAGDYIEMDAFCRSIMGRIWVVEANTEPLNYHQVIS